MESNQDNIGFEPEEKALRADQKDEKKCILIYDDDQEILLLCKMFLIKNGYEVETKSKCENVIADIHNLKPDLILMDLWIPEIGGEKAISMVKENPATRHTPVLLFSANADIDVICKKVNANGYIAKPFDIHTFKDVIALHVEKKD